MKRITEWIKRHQVLAFFLLAYAISWPCMFLIYFIFPGNQVVEGLAGPIMVFSPALTAMLIAGLAESAPKTGSRRARWAAFALSWLISAVVLVLYGWKVQSMELGVVVIYYSLVGLLPAWVLSSTYARIPGIRGQFSTLLKPRGPAVWYLVIFLIFPGVPLLAMGITRLFNGEAHFYLADLGFQAAATYLVLEFLRGFLMTGGINEESGWRGFALPRLQARYPVLVSAVIVWFFWAFWHLPYDLGRGDSLAWILENRLFWNLLFAILMTWLYNRTQGSILAPALFHPAMNAFGNAFSITLAGRVLFIALTVYAIVSDRMWEKLPEADPAGHQAGSQTPLATVSGYSAAD